MLTPDIPAIKARFIDSGRKYTAWARAKGINPDTFQSFLIGRFLPKEGEVIERIVASLKADGLWVDLLPETEDLRRTRRKRYVRPNGDKTSSRPA